MKRKEMNPFYLTKGWRNKREYILLRDKYLCQECKSKNKFTIATMVHHVKPLENFPELALTDSNLISLCSMCHESHHDRWKNRREAAKPCGVRVIKM